MSNDSRVVDRVAAKLKQRAAAGDIPAMMFLLKMSLTDKTLSELIEDLAPPAKREQH